ncbi:hypothetical protein [Microbacterium sp. YY-01]|uniref:phage tail tube protein n=1 Tax=Microbacterium sp. YY-01 TaxID=3421634 RepID=UPI003D182193
MNEPVQMGQSAAGHGIVILAPFDSVEDPSKPTVAELSASGNIRITYGLMRDGFRHEPTINKVTVGRYTMAQDLSYEGTITESLTMKYPYNRQTPTEAELALGEKGVDYYVFQLLGYPNDHEITAGDKINTVTPIRTATSVDVPDESNDSNSELQKQMVPDIIGQVLREVEVVSA